MRHTVAIEVVFKQTRNPDGGLYSIGCETKIIDEVPEGLTPKEAIEAILEDCKKASDGKLNEWLLGNSEGFQTANSYGGGAANGASSGSTNGSSGRGPSYHRDQGNGQSSDISQPQMGKIHAMVREDPGREGLIAGYLKQVKKESLDKLTKREASALIDKLTST